MKSYVVKKGIIILFLIIGAALMAIDIYLYHFFPKHAAHHYDASTGAIYQVCMDGVCVFLTLRQDLAQTGTFCSTILSFGIAAYLSNRWKLGTPHSII